MPSNKGRVFHCPGLYWCLVCLDCSPSSPGVDSSQASLPPTHRANRHNAEKCRLRPVFTCLEFPFLQPRPDISLHRHVPHEPTPSSPSTAPAYCASLPHSWQLPPLMTSWVAPPCRAGLRQIRRPRVHRSNDERHEISTKLPRTYIYLPRQYFGSAHKSKTALLSLSHPTRQLLHSTHQPHPDNAYSP